MAKHDKKQQNNPFSEEENVDVNADNKENSETENQDSEENTTPAEAETVATQDETSETNSSSEEKKGIFDGLFKKNDEDLKKMKEAYDNLNNQYLRLAADFDNYRKRQDSEKESLIKYGTEQALKKMIEIADNFERAEKSMDSIEECEKAKEAFHVLNKQFKDALSKLGLEAIQAEGEKFDPNLHEAIMQVPTDEKPEETVMQEMQKGYKYGDKVLRPSMVSVSVSKWKENGWLLRNIGSK